MIEAIKKKLAERNERIAINKMNQQLKDPRSEVSKRLRNETVVLATGLMMNWLDVRRIRHCKICPSTGTLYKNGQDFYCQIHNIQSKEEIHAS
jgi:hypothetical protein